MGKIKRFYWLGTKRVYWLAGLLEGDGCFSLHNDNNRRKKYPLIRLSMSDKDVVEKAAKMFKRKCGTASASKSSFCKKQMYQTRIRGVGAENWMRLLYPIMGKRRKAKIREILAFAERQRNA